MNLFMYAALARYQSRFKYLSPYVSIHIIICNVPFAVKSKSPAL